MVRLLKDKEAHTPDICSTGSASPLTDEINILPVFTPLGTEIVSSMICELREFGAVSMAGIYVCIPIN